MSYFSLTKNLIIPYFVNFNCRILEIMTKILAFAVIDVFFEAFEYYSSSFLILHFKTVFCYRFLFFAYSCRFCHLLLKYNVKVYKTAPRNLYIREKKGRILPFRIDTCSKIIYNIVTKILYTCARVARRRYYVS